MTKFIKWLIIFVGGAIVLAFIISLIAAFKLTSDFKNIVDKSSRFTLKLARL